MSVLDAGDLRRAQTRIAHEIVERNRGAADVVLVGLYTRGLAIARRLADAIAEFEDLDVPVGALDVSFYRDDIGLRAVTPTGPTEVPVDITGRVVVLVDDVLYTGRTVRAGHGRAHRARPPAGDPARGPRRPRPPGAADPPRLRGQEPPHPHRRGRPRAPRPRSTADPIPSSCARTQKQEQRGRCGMKHLLVDRRPRRREPHRDPRPLGAVRRRQPARHPEGARAPRQGGGVALLRGLHPHPPQLRDRGQAPLLRRHDLQRLAVVGEEGREPPRHRADHRGHGHRRDGDPPPVRRRAAPGRRVDRRRR